MKRILTLALVAAALGFSGTVSAQETTTPEHRPMGPLYITKGHIEVGGAGAYTKAAEGGDWELELNPKVEYFILNRFSVGGTVRYTDAKLNGQALNSQLEIGPSITYYLTHTAKWALSIDQSIRFAKPETGDNYIAGETGLAFDYFFTESIAVGPAVKAMYYFNGDADAPGDATRYLVNFSLFL